MSKKSPVYNQHLTLSDRQIIEKGICNGSTKTSIAETIGKEKSTVCKEIKLHRSITHKCNLPLECASYKSCKLGRHCTKECTHFTPFTCKRRDRSPGACNGCEAITKCRFNKITYDSSKAHSEYLESLKTAREGFNITMDEVKRIGSIIKPLIDQGLSPYAASTNHPEIGICEKTLYNYIESPVFKDAGIQLDSMSLRRKVSRKIPKERARLYKKRNDFRYLQNRKYSDFLKYMEDNPNAHVVEMDTVYNDVSNGPFIQTFKFRKYHFMIGFLHETRSSSSMLDGINRLEEIIGRELFEKEVEVLLTDRGSEFVLADETEKRSDGTIRTRIFYCDPMASRQKGSLENNHIELRYILPKGTDLKELGLVSQDDLNLVMSHANSFSKELLDGKSPYDILEFFNPKLADKFKAFGIQNIEKDKVILKPYLLKK